MKWFQSDKRKEEEKKDSIEPADSVGFGTMIEKDRKPKQGDAIESPSFNQVNWGSQPTEFTRFSKGKELESFWTKPVYQDVKLVILLIENTEEVAKEKEKLEKILKSILTAGYVCLINYGSEVRTGQLVEAKRLNCEDILCQEDLGQKTCLFDALTTLESVVDEKYEKMEFVKNKRIKIHNIEIIGIGRCLDNASHTSMEMAIVSFCQVAAHKNVVSKYFCLSEEEFIRAATIGFRSIGAINRSYK